jgi:putative lipoic acid-binding regulatory protein
VNGKSKGPVLEYPCRWTYKVVGKDREELSAALREIFKNRSCDASLSNVSSRGTYLCMNVETTVFSDEDRRALFALLSRHPVVKIVL